MKKPPMVVNLQLDLATRTNGTLTDKPREGIE